MALAARATTAPSGPNIASAHMPSGGRNVASMAVGPVDELTPKAEVLPDPNYNFQGFSEWMQQRRRAPLPEPVRTPTPGTVDTPTSTFVSLLGQEQSDREKASPATIAKRSFQGMLSKAIRAYEGTADTISGAPSPRGVNLSVSL